MRTVCVLSTSQTEQNIHNNTTAIRVNILTFCTSTEHAFDMSTSEITYIVSGGALNSTHSLIHVRTTNSILLTLW